MERVAALVRRYVDVGRYPGAVTAVARRDKVELFEACGLADTDRGREMRPDTIFRIFSMTKPLVSLGRPARYDGPRLFGA